MIDIPSKSENGLQEPDFNKQKEMASVYNNVERIKQKMSRILQDLSEIVVEMPSS